MPNINPATAIVAWTTLLRHLGLATDASSTNTLALVAVCKCVCIDGEDKGKCVTLELRWNIAVCCCMSQKHAV